MSGIHSEGALGFGDWAGYELVSGTQNDHAWEAEMNIGQGIQNEIVCRISCQGQELETP